MWILIWLLMVKEAFAVTTPSFALTETVFFGSDPGSCDTVADVVDSDHDKVMVIGGRTKSKNLWTNTGDNTCHAQPLPYLTNIKPDGSMFWLNYFSTSPYLTEFSAVRLSPHKDYTVDTTYSKYVVAILKSTSFADMAHQIVLVDPVLGTIYGVNSYPREVAPMQA